VLALFFATDKIALLDLHVSMVGTDWPHELDELVDRPTGFGEYLFLRFRTPMLVRTARGVQKCRSGTCLIYAPGHAQWYQGDRIAFRDDWCHVSGSSVPGLLKQAGLPLNLLFMPRNTSFFPLIIEQIQSELQRREAFWQEAVALATARLILLLGRGLKEVDDRHEGVDVVRRERLRRVRELVHARLSERWTVAQMAKLAKMGNNRFAVLYSEAFGVSPVEDLIQARLRHAEWLLTNRQTTVGEAAELSGFGSIHYFSRLFRRRVGCAPSDYYRSPKL
jgi:AraC-like DNA-binding protein